MRDQTKNSNPSYFQGLDTDYYQLTMTLTYIITGTARDRVGFEGFYRHPKNSFPEENYIFAGDKVKKVVARVFKEIKNPDFPETMLFLLKHRIPQERYNKYAAEVRRFFKEIRTDIENGKTLAKVSYYPDGAPLPPYVPFFQYSGERWLGQLLETSVLVAANGPTGWATQKHYGQFSKVSLDMLETLVYSEDENRFVEQYLQGVEKRAEQYRKATKKVLLDASYRRAPSVFIANMATKIALESGWEGTANAGAAMRGLIPVEKTGGTHAHSLVMGNTDPNDPELAAFMAWNSVFPNSTILVDTFNVEKAITKLLDNNIKPADIRIDSSPLIEHLLNTRRTLDEHGWNDVGLFASGDITPEMLSNFEEKKVPYNKAMAGTQYVNHKVGHLVNAGFVYKLVEVDTPDGRTLYPEKKATGKTNYPGLKYVYIENGKMVVECRPETGFGIEIEPNDTINDVVFVR